MRNKMPQTQKVEGQLWGFAQESSTNFEAVFRAFYQMFPYGRFAHLAANSAILEAIPEDAYAVHVIDLHIGEGVQWVPMIEAMAQQHRTLRININKVGRGGELCSLPWRFEEVRRQLCHHARCFNLKLKVDEMGLEELVAELKRMMKRGGGGKEFLCFNCKTALPHMEQEKSRKLVREFLTAAKGLLANSGSCVYRNRGITTFGDGEVKSCHEFGGFFDGYLGHYQAILESMETHFPEQLKEAIMAMECLFVAPSISSHILFQKWEEMKEDCRFREGIGLKGVRIIREIEIEAKEMVRGGTSSFGVRSGGIWGNEIVLD